MPEAVGGHVQPRAVHPQFELENLMPAKLLGIDVGTGGTRAVLIDEQGTVIASRTAEHKAFASPETGWAEQDPHDWWRATCEAIKQVMATSGTSPSEIAAVGFSGQMHGAVLLDAAGEVLRPALIWCDQRTAEEAQALTAQLGEQQIIAWTCNPALTNFTLTKLLWVRKHEPELYERFRTLLLAQGLRSLPSHRRLRHGHGRCIRHTVARRSQSALVDRDGPGHADRSRVPASTVRIARCLRHNLRFRSSRDRPVEGHSGGCRSRRSGCRRSWTRHRESRRGARHHRYLGRGVRGHRSPGARS